MRKLICLLILLICTGCAEQPVSVTDFALDTVVSVTLYGGDEVLARECIELCREYENLFSKTKPGSDVWNINTYGEVSVDAETVKLIRKALYYSQLSDGLFDISVGAASSLWDFDSGALPDEKQLADAAEKINYRDILVSGNTVSVKEGVKLDAGAIAKGYIADKMAKFLKGKGITSAIVNLGGNVVCIGDKKGRPFEIGIQKPFASGEVALTLPVTGKSVVTAGIYERSFEKDGVFYHHILDPKTGYPVQNDLASVTVITDLSIDGDALSTTLFLMGKEKGFEFARDNDIAAVFITREGKVIKTGEIMNYE